MAYAAPDGSAAQRDHFSLAARMYDETSDASRRLNGSTALPDHFYRNVGVAYSQLARLEPDDHAAAGA